MRLGRHGPLHGHPTLALSLVALGAFALLAVLVSLGHLDAVDSYAVRHLMPFHSDEHRSTSTLARLLAYKGHRFHLGRALRLPAGVLVSSVLVVAGCALLWRRGLRRASVLWLLAFAAGNVVELGCKLAVTRPVLYEVSHGRLEPFGLLNSFPSGHAFRAAMLVAVAFALSPRTWPVLAAWLTATVVTLELDGVHTPSDLLGGLLLAATAVLAVLAFAQAPTPLPGRSSMRAVASG